MNFATRTETTRDDWQTPAYIVESLGEFDLDPCANINNPFRLARTGFPVGGLDLPWAGRVWLNPPYGDDAQLWMSKLAAHGDGIALIPPRMGSQWFHDLVLSTCDAMLFIRGRISFLDEDLNPVKGNNADSCLIAFGARNVLSLSSCNLSGKFWKLR